MTKKKVLNVLFSVLLFGGLWGILEATLGSLLHMHFIPNTMFLASSTIMVPIAYFLMGACYKRTGTFASSIYMAILAGAIKLIACLIFHMAVNPVYYILMEGFFMGVALLIIRPKNIIAKNKSPMEIGAERNKTKENVNSIKEKDILEEDYSGINYNSLTDFEYREL